MLIDDKGNSLVQDQDNEKKYAEIRRIYAEMMNAQAPKTKEDEDRFWAELVSRVVRWEHKNRVHNIETGYGGLFERNYKARADDVYTGWEDRKRGLGRHVASIPPDILRQAEKVYGPDVLRDRDLFRKAFAEDEVGQMCLRVDPKTL